MLFSFFEVSHYKLGPHGNEAIDRLCDQMNNSPALHFSEPLKMHHVLNTTMYSAYKILNHLNSRKHHHIPHLTCALRQTPLA
jgi:hypothetical protein